MHAVLPAATILYLVLTSTLPVCTAPPTHLTLLPSTPASPLRPACRPHPTPVAACRGGGRQGVPALSELRRLPPPHVPGGPGGRRGAAGGKDLRGHQGLEGRQVPRCAVMLLCWGCAAGLAVAGLPGRRYARLLAASTVGLCAATRRASAHVCLPELALCPLPLPPALPPGLQRATGWRRRTASPSPARLT